MEAAMLTSVAVTSLGAGQQGVALSSEGLHQTPRTGLRHPASNRCHNWLRHYDFGTVKLFTKLQALVYDILPQTVVIIDYAIGLEKPSANGQFFVDVQTAVRL